MQSVGDALKYLRVSRRKTNSCHFLVAVLAVLSSICVSFAVEVRGFHFDAKEYPSLTGFEEYRNELKIKTSGSVLPDSDVVRRETIMRNATDVFTLTILVSQDPVTNSDQEALERYLRGHYSNALAKETPNIIDGADRSLKTPSRIVVVIGNVAYVVHVKGRTRKEAAEGGAVALVTEHPTLDAQALSEQILSRIIEQNSGQELTPITVNASDVSVVPDKLRLGFDEDNVLKAEIDTKAIERKGGTILAKSEVVGVVPSEGGWVAYNSDRYQGEAEVILWAISDSLLASRTQITIRCEAKPLVMDIRAQLTSEERNAIMESMMEGHSTKQFAESYPDRDAFDQEYERRAKKVIADREGKTAAP